MSAPDDKIRRVVNGCNGYRILHGAETVQVDDEYAYVSTLWSDKAGWQKVALDQIALTVDAVQAAVDVDVDAGELLFRRRRS